MQTLLSSAYLAPVQYYTKLIWCDDVYIEQCENYVKQSYRNRCNIVSANGVLGLSIPVIHNSGDKILMRDVRISEQINWQHMHWNAILSAYNSSPFFEYFKDDFFPFYHTKFKFLFDFNAELLKLLLNLLNIKVDVKYTDGFVADTGNGDFRYLIHPKKKCEDASFFSQSYYQVYGQKYGFIENMSIIDLLFNMGNESLIVLMNSCKE